MDGSLEQPKACILRDVATNEIFVRFGNFASDLAASLGKFMPCAALEPHARNGHALARGTGREALGGRAELSRRQLLLMQRVADLLSKLGNRRLCDAAKHARLYVRRNKFAVDHKNHVAVRGLGE